MPLALPQKARARLQMLGSTAVFNNAVVEPMIARTFERRGGPQAVPENGRLSERLRAVAGVVEDLPEYQFNRFYSRWQTEEMHRRSRQAVAAAEDQARAMLDQVDGGGTLELNPDLDVPEYYRGIEFHLSPGGWDPELIGVIIEEAAYPYVMNVGGSGAVKPNTNVLDQRASTARETPHGDYRRILDMGTGVGRFAGALQAAFPKAAVHGVDLSAGLLRYNHALAARKGYTFSLRQAPAERTGYPDAMFDLVGIYTVFHEVPTPACKAIVAEAFRVLEPGGDVLIADIAPYKAQPPLQAFILDWETENRGEPYWRGALSRDLPEMLKNAGFERVEEYGLGPEKRYPWITRATKPR